MPAVLAVGGAPEAERGLVAQAFRHRVPPAGQRALQIVRVQHRRPLARERELRRRAGVVHPALVVVVDRSVGARRPYDLRHGVRELVPARLAEAQALLRAAPLLGGAGERPPAQPDEKGEAHHDRAREQQRAGPVVEQAGVLAAKPQPAEEVRDDDDERQQPAGGRAAGVVGHERFHEAALGARAEQAQAESEEQRRRVQRHLRVAGQRQRHLEQVRGHRGQGQDGRQHDGGLAGGSKGAPGRAETQEGQADQHEVERGRRRHPPGRPRVPVVPRVGDQCLVDAEVIPAGCVLQEREGADGEDGRGTDASAAWRRRRGRSPGGPVSCG